MEQNPNFHTHKKLMASLSVVTPALTVMLIATAVAAPFPLNMGNGAATQAPVREEGGGMRGTISGKVKRTKKGLELVQSAMAL